MRIRTLLATTALVLAPPAGVALGSASATWNARTDFRLGAAHANPSPDAAGRSVWVYMMGRQGASGLGSLSLLRNFSTAWDGANTQFWSGTTAGWQGKTFPLVGIRPGSLSRPGMLTVHPIGGTTAVIGWRSPINGSVGVSVRLVDLDPGGGDGVSWTLSLDGKIVKNGAIANGQAGAARLSNLGVRKGQLVWVAVGSGSNANDTYDTTAVGIVVSAT